MELCMMMAAVKKVTMREFFFFIFFFFKKVCAEQQFNVNGTVLVGGLSSNIYYIHFWSVLKEC